MPDLRYSKQSDTEGTSLLGPYAVINSFETLIYYTPVNAFNPLNAELNPICHLLALLGARHILHISRIWVNLHVSINLTRLTPNVALGYVITVSYFQG
jgi:hypothetical protein